MEMTLNTTSEFIARTRWSLMEAYQELMPYLWFTWYGDEIIIHYPLIGRDDDNQLFWDATK